MSNSEAVELSSKGARTRAHILDVAWDLIAERGAEVGLAEIAKAAGVTRQNVYVHFGSRGGLLMALVKRADERSDIFARFASAMAAADPAARLDGVLREWLSYVPEILPVARDLIRLRPVDEDARAAWDDRMGELLGAFRHLTKSLAAEKALADGWTPKKAAEFLWAIASVQAAGLLIAETGWRPAQASAAIRQAAAATLLA